MSIEQSFSTFNFQLSIVKTNYLYMKQLFWSLIVILLVAGCSSKESFIIDGNIADGEGKKVYLFRMDLVGDVPIDSIKIKKNGNFKFSLKALKNPEFYKLQFSNENFITLLGDTTEHITVTGSVNSFAKNYKVENSQGSRFVQILGERVVNLRSKVDSLSNLYASMSDNEKTLRVEAISNELNAAVDEYKKWIGEFVFENPRSFASYYALFLTLSDNTPVMNIWDKQDQIYFAAIATSLNLEKPEAERVKQLYSMVLSVKKEQRKSEALEKLTSEATDKIPELKIKDVDGNEVALSSLRGKVVLLSFWATWDDASKRENQNLKRIYKKYKSRGFEVYQVGLERSKVVWESVLLQDEIPWISVTDLEYTESYAAKVYNVQQLPANYLISRDGEIIGKNLFNDMLDEKLGKVL